MREFKFRAWDNQEKKMIDKYAEFTSDSYFYWGIDFTKGQTVELMQYTGLKDKNGKEIYEGDIVNLYDNNYEVAWGEADFQNYYGYTGIILKNCVSATTQQEDAQSWEIVGNVYENPELLAPIENEVASI